VAAPHTGLGHAGLVSRCLKPKKSEKNQEKIGQDQTKTTTAKRKRTNDWQLGSWNVRTLSTPGALKALILELRHYRYDITAIQEARAGHVVRREENHPLKKAFEGEFRDGNRRRGRPKNSWKDAVSRDCAEFGLTNWQRTAKDRNKFNKFLDSVKSRSRDIS
jgi:hypothetical protein